MSVIDLKLKSYDELIFEITTLNTNNYLLQQKVEDKNKEIDRLNNIIDKAKEYIKEWQRFPHTNGSTHKELENLMKILDK